MMSSFFGRGGRREESQNDSESLSNDANPSIISTPETEGLINQLQAELEAKDAKITEQNSVIAQLRNEVESMDDLKSLNWSLQEAIAAKDEKIVDPNSSSSSQQAEDNDEKIVDLDAMKSSLQTERDLKNAKIAEQKKLLNSQQEMIQTKDDEIAKLNSLVSKLKSEVDSKSEEVEKLQTEFQSTKSSLLHGANIIIASLDKNNESLTKPFEMLREVKENQQASNNEGRIINLESNLKAKDVKISLLLKAILGKNVKITEQNKLVKSLVEKNKSLTKSVKKMTEVVGRDNENITETTIRATFTEISKLSDTLVYSQPTHFDGIDWCFDVCKEDDNLEVYLNGEKPNADKWSCSVFVELELISQKDENIVTSKFYRHMFNEQADDMGFQFISFKDLFDEEMGYVKDDSILISAYIRVFPSE